MTHSLHRAGCEEDLARDYVLLAMLSRDVNLKDPRARQRLERAGWIFKSHGPVNMMMERLWEITPVITAVYDDEKNAFAAMKELKRENLGISIVISGLVSKIAPALEEMGLQMHTVHYSLGTFGRKEDLPADEILEITTMCGHHCISPASVTHQVARVKEGRVTLERAATELARPCVCGIFNTTRAKQVLKRLATRAHP